MGICTNAADRRFSNAPPPSWHRSQKHKHASCRTSRNSSFPGRSVSSHVGRQSGFLLRLSSCACVRVWRSLVPNRPRLWQVCADCFYSSTHSPSASHKSSLALSCIVAPKSSSRFVVLTFFGKWFRVCWTICGGLMHRGLSRALRKSRDGRHWE